MISSGCPSKPQGWFTSSSGGSPDHTPAAPPPPGPLLGPWGLPVPPPGLGSGVLLLYRVTCPSGRSGLGELPWPLRRSVRDPGTLGFGPPGLFPLLGPGALGGVNLLPGPGGSPRCSGVDSLPLSKGQTTLGVQTRGSGPPVLFPSRGTQVRLESFGSSFGLNSPEAPCPWAGPLGSQSPQSAL